MTLRDDKFIGRRTSPILGVFEESVHVSLRLRPIASSLGHVLENGLIVGLWIEQMLEEGLRTRSVERSDGAVGRSHHFLRIVGEPFTGGLIEANCHGKGG